MCQTAATLTIDLGGTCYCIDLLPGLHWCQHRKSWDVNITKSEANFWRLFSFPQRWNLKLCTSSMCSKVRRCTRAWTLVQLHKASVAMNVGLAVFLSKGMGEGWRFEAVSMHLFMMHTGLHNTCANIIFNAVEAHASTCNPLGSNTVAGPAHPQEHSTNN